MNNYETFYIWDYETSCHDTSDEMYMLDEMHIHHDTQYTYDLDDEYARDSMDYQELAYKHYA